MPLPHISGVMRCAIRMTATGCLDEVINVVHLHATSSDTESDVDAALEPRWATMTRDRIPTIFTFQDVTLTRLDGSAAVVIPWSHAQPDGGSNTLPMNAAACFSWRTALAGRAHRGRSFIGPMIPSMLDATHPDKIDSSTLSALTTLGNAFIAGLVADGFPLLVASYTHVSADDVTRCVVNPKVCTVRKRVNGR